MASDDREYSVTELQARWNKIRVAICTIPWIRWGILTNASIWAFGRCSRTNIWPGWR